MCGIAGLMFKKGAGDIGDMMTEMCLAQQHRGPDSTGFALYGEPQPAGSYIAWVKLEDPENIATLSELELREWQELERAETLEAIAAIDGVVTEAEIVAGQQIRLVVEYEGESKTLVDTIEGVSGSEVISLGRSMEIIKDVGLANEVADAYKLRTFHGTHALGHVRMATESTVDVSHAHPFWAYPFPDICVVHNGQITNYWKYRRLLELKGRRFRSRNDSELIAVYIADQMTKGLSLREAMERSLSDLDGVFTYFVATEDEIGVAKDALAAKPLVVMEDENVVGLASEEVALRAIFPAEIESWDPFEEEILVWGKSI